MDIVTRSCVPPSVNERCTVKGLQTNLITASSSSQNPTYYFALNNSSIGAGFFDQYRIHAVRFDIRPEQNAIGLTTNSTTSVVPIYCVIDYDDDTALGSLGAATAYSNVVVIPPGRSCSRTFAPRIAVAAYSGSFGGYTNLGPQWIDSSSNTVRHYGIKLWIPAVVAAQTQLQTWEVNIEYFIELRKAI